MPRNRPQNQFKRRRLSEPMIDRGFTSTGYYMWDYERLSVYRRDTYRDSVCTAAAANKRSADRHFSGVYFRQGECFIMLDFIMDAVQSN